jgi:oligosaccharide repeat unit polymerase
MLQLENLVMGVGPFAVILLLDRRSTILQRLTCAIVAIWPLLRGYGTGTRGNIIFALVPMMAVIYFRCKPQVQRGLLILALCATPLVYWFMAVVVASRNAGTLDFEQGAKTQYVGNEMFQELLYLVHNIPARLPYQMGETYYEELCGPIPRVLWAGKPDSLKFLLPQMRGEIDKRTGQAYYTRSPGLLGEMYLNFGFLGLFFVSFVGGWLVRGWDQIPLANASSLPTMIFYVAGLGALYLQGRSFSLLVVYPLIFFVMAVFVISYCSKGTEPAL